MNNGMKCNKVLTAQCNHTQLDYTNETLWT